MWQVKLPLADIFKNPTVRGIAASIQASPQRDYSAIQPAPSHDYYPLSPAQRQIFVMQQMDTGSSAYNMPQSIDLAESINLETLENNFRGLIQRHESLRTGFFIVNGRPVQKIFEDVDFNLEYMDASDFGTAEIEGLLDRFVKPFDLTAPPLLRAGVFKTREKRYVLMFDVHHIVADGGSLDILVEDFLTLNSGQELEPVGLQYKDFAYWQHEAMGADGIKKQEEYWLNRFSGPIPRLNLPLDFPRPEALEFGGERLFFKIDEEVASRLRALTMESEATMFMTLLAIYAVALSKIGGEEDVVIGCPVAGRNHPDLERTVGMFVNMLAHRSSVRPYIPFKQLLRDVRLDTLAAFENQNYPFESLVGKLGLSDTKRNPVFDVAFDLHDLEPGEEAALSRQVFEDDGGGVHFENKTAKFDLSLDVRVGAGLICIFEYATSLFKRETVENFKNHFRQVAETVADNPDIEICRIELTHDLLEPTQDGLMEDDLDFNF
jgi:hypothetical protein